jgi:hypothetical protein
MTTLSRSARSVAAFPSTAHKAGFEAGRLGSAELAQSIRQLAELISRGELAADHVWPVALVMRQVKEVAAYLRVEVPPPGVENLRTVAHRRQLGLALIGDETLRPMLLVPASHETLRAAAQADPLGVMERFADELDAQQVRGLDSEALELGRIDEDRARMQALTLAVEPPYPSWPRSRRQAQRMRRLLAGMDGKDWTPGRGRRPGAEGRVAKARRQDLLARYLDLPQGEQERMIALRSTLARAFVIGHKERHGVSMATAERDWLWVRSTLAERGQLGYIGLIEPEQVPELERRLFGA